MVLTDAKDHSHFNAAQLVRKGRMGERILTEDKDGTFPKKLFDVKGSYQQCVDWFYKTAQHLIRKGHCVYTFKEEVARFPRLRMLVNLPPEDVEYMQTHNMIFLKKENEAENMSGKSIEAGYRKVRLS